MMKFEGGHYVCYALNKLTQRWYEFDDTIVSEVSEEEVTHAEAYVLFYLRRTPPELIEERRKIESLIEEGVRRSLLSPSLSLSHSLIRCFVFSCLTQLHNIV
jgi:hypothetical protein